MSGKKICPLATNDNSERLAVYCCEEHCAWWDDDRESRGCVLISITITLGRIENAVRELSKEK